MINFRYISFRKALIRIVLLVALLTVFLVGVILFIRPPSDSTANLEPTTNTSSIESPQEQNTLRATELLGTVKAIKNNLRAALEDFKQNNFSGARNKLNSVRRDVASTTSFINKYPLLLSLVPQSEYIPALMDAADTAIAEILLPAVDLLETRPLSSLKVGDGFDVTILHAYLDFGESIMPKVESLMTTANSVDFSMIDSEGKIKELLGLANELLAFYHEYPEILSMLKSMLGAEEDRLYLIAVQNPSEIRASGGFPGSMGTIRIQGGILTVGEFETVVNFLATTTPKNIQITKEEYALFHHLSGIRTPRDADLCPDFERVGHIWASSYEEWHKEPVSGIISVTPHIVQRILDVLDTEIKLFDGLVLNGENALKVLIHDIYFKYYDRNNLSEDRGVISDQLFADAAKKVLELITDNVSVTQLIKYLPVIKESIEDRTLMFWFSEEEEQSLIVDLGWHGGLNRDPETPEAGVYVNVVSASKMGWFLLMDIEMSEGNKNKDGSYTYPITVTFSNNVTPEEVATATTYISGGLNGSMYAAAYFFAPAGGSVDNFTISNGLQIANMTYNGMTLGFLNKFMIRPDDVITVTYTVTTAPGVETPLTFSKTPTAQ